MHFFGSLADNALCGIKHGEGTYTTEGINALCDVLKGNDTITSLKYAGHLDPHPHLALTAFDAVLALPWQPGQHQLG